MNALVEQGLIVVAGPMAAGAIARVVAGPGGEGSRRAWVMPVLMAATAAGVHVMLFGGVKVPPEASIGWMPVVTLTAALLGVVEWVARLGWMARWVGRVVVMALAGYVGIRAHWAGGVLTAAAAWGWMAGFVAVGMVMLMGLEGVRGGVERRPGWGLVPAVVVGGAGAMLVTTMGSLKLSQDVGSVGAFLGGVALASGLRGWGGRGGMVVPAVVAMEGLVQGLRYGGQEESREWVARLGAGLVVASGWAALGADAGVMGRWSGWKRVAARAVLAGVPVAAGVAVFAWVAMRSGGA